MKTSIEYTETSCHASQMVNIGSQIPFNLHNQVLPPKIDHSLSRIASSTSDYFDSSGGFSEGINYRQSYPPAPYRSFTISASPDLYSDRSRSRSKSMDQEREPSTRILNVRLVSFVDRRGRTIRRNQSDNAIDSTASDSTPTASTLRPLTGDSSSSTNVSLGVLIVLPHHLICLKTSVANLKLHEAGAVSLSWGD